MYSDRHAIVKSSAMKHDARNGWYRLVDKRFGNRTGISARGSILRGSTSKHDTYKAPILTTETIRTLLTAAFSLICIKRYPRTSLLKTIFSYHDQERAGFAGNEVLGVWP